VITSEQSLVNVDIDYGCFGRSMLAFAAFFFMASVSKLLVEHYFLSEHSVVYISSISHNLRFLHMNDVG